MGRTTPVEHIIPLIERAKLLLQPPHRLKPEKEAEAKRQIADLLRKDLIEPVSSAWSSLGVSQEQGWEVVVLHRLQALECCNRTICISLASD